MKYSLEKDTHIPNYTSRWSRRLIKVSAIHTLQATGQEVIPPRTWNSVAHSYNTIRSHENEQIEHVPTFWVRVVLSVPSKEGKSTNLWQAFRKDAYW